MKIGWKGYFLERSVKKLQLKIGFDKPTFFVWSRYSQITPEFIGCMVRIYNGKYYSKRLLVQRIMVGHKFGEFFSTKQLGSKIHDSYRTRKRLAKLRQKRR